MALDRDVMTSRGELTLFVGCMMSGKTEALLTALRRESVIPRTCVLCVKYSADDRFATAGIMTHSGEEMGLATVVQAKTLSEVPQARIDEADVIGIDEGQFFEDLHLVEKWTAARKKVYIAALNGTYERKPWPNLTPVWPLLTECIFLKARCLQCGGNATFSHDFKGHGTTDVEIGGAEKYRPLCQDCYVEENPEKA
jgi:thymidine kinase